MPTVAEQLRAAREAQTLSISHVAEITKIKTDPIRALESGTYDSFSAPVYIRGFVRTYAKALNLDVTQLTATLEAELSQTEKFREPPPLTNQPRGTLDFLMLQLSKLSWRILVGGLAGVVALIVALSLFSSWRKSKETDPLKHLGPGLYQARPGQAGALPPPPPNPPPPPPTP